MGDQQKFKRKIKLIKPRLQLKLTLIFVGLSALSLLLQLLLFMSTLADTALNMPNDSHVLLSHTNNILFRVLATSFLIVLPITYGVGILSTFKVAGPLFRFEMFLNQVIRGEKPEDFRLRKGDELHDLAALLNAATEPLRRGEPEPEEVDDEPFEEPRSLTVTDEHERRPEKAVQRDAP